MKNRFSHTAAYIEQLKSIDLQISQNQLQEAALALNRLAQADPQDPRLFLLGSRLAEAANNPDGMLQAARKAYQLAPQWPTTAVHLAGVLASRGESNEAMAMAAQAVQHATTQTTLDTNLLSAAAAVAQRLAQFPQALEWLRQSEQLDPRDTSTRYKIGLALSANGSFSAAIDVFTALLTELPQNTAILSARMQAYLAAQKPKLAIKDGKALLVLEPKNEEHQFYLAVARGETPKTQPASIIANRFNSDADHFDHHLVVQLQYKLPRDVAQMIDAWYPERDADMLDLGCGTGLLGACLGRTKGVLVGVDLSQRMLDQAIRHNVYDRFHNVNVLDALAATPENLYHVITALDVFIYVGSLDAAIPDAHRILLPEGRLVFSCEAEVDSEDDFSLKPTYRYTHKRSYVERLLKDAGFEHITIEDRVLRLEGKLPVTGFLVTAQKHALEEEKAPSAKKTVRRSPKSAKPAPPAQ